MTPAKSKEILRLIWEQYPADERAIVPSPSEFTCFSCPNETGCPSRWNRDNIDGECMEGNEPQLNTSEEDEL